MIEIVLTAVALAISYWLGRDNGKKTEEVKSQEAYLNAIRKAKNAKHKLDDPEYVDSLWSKYKK